LFFGHKGEPKHKLEVDLGELENEKENLTNFLKQHLKVEVYLGKNKVSVDAEKTTLTDLYQAVKKFVYHRHLNNTHYVLQELSKVKISRLKGHEKKKEDHKKEVPHKNEIQTWGL
jgi:exosome complex RNA-binding protein Rrp4